MFLIIKKYAPTNETDKAFMDMVNQLNAERQKKADQNNKKVKPKKPKK